MSAASAGRVGQSPSDPQGRYADAAGLAISVTSNHMTAAGPAVSIEVADTHRAPDAAGLASAHADPHTSAAVPAASAIAGTNTQATTADAASPARSGTHAHMGFAGLAAPYMTAEQYAAMRAFARRAEQAERVAIALSNQRRAFNMADWSEDIAGTFDTAIHAFQLEAKRLQRHAMKAAKGTAIHEWAMSTVGVGPALFFVLGQMPPLGPLDVQVSDLPPFHSVSGVWKYCGLHVDGGRAPKRSAGVLAGFSSRLRAYVLVRLGKPSIYNRASPYRDVYDARKAFTAVTHPDMLEQGAGCAFCDDSYVTTKTHRAERKNLTRERVGVAFDCANRGGPHWKPAHRDADALRVMTKAILRDAWRVANGMSPRTAAVPPTTPTPVSSSFAEISGGPVFDDFGGRSHSDNHGGRAAEVVEEAACRC